MFKASINISKCPQSHECPSMKLCPVGAIHQEGFNAPIINKEICIGCGKCTRFCPKQALYLEEIK